MLDEKGSSCGLSSWKIFYAILSCCFTFNLSTLRLYFCSINVSPLLTSQTALSVFFLKSHVTPGTAAFTSALQTQRQKHVDAEWSGYHVSTQCSFQPFLTCVASVSVRFRSKQLGARVKDRESKRAGRGGEERKETFFFLPFGSRSISRAAKTENPVTQSSFDPSRARLRTYCAR